MCKTMKFNYYIYKKDFARDYFFTWTILPKNTCFSLHNTKENAAHNTFDFSFFMKRLYGKIEELKTKLLEKKMKKIHGNLTEFQFWDTLNKLKLIWRTFCKFLSFSKFFSSISKLKFIFCFLIIKNSNPSNFAYIWQILFVNNIIRNFNQSAASNQLNFS